MPLFANIVALTHQGAIRTANEDTIGVAAWVRTEPMGEPRQVRVDLSVPFAVVVCDGMGGHEAGEVASGIAACQLSLDLNNALDTDGVVAALRKVNRMIFDAANMPGGRPGMGTTVAGLWASAEGLIWFNVGDSRVYRIRDGFLRQLSIDDTNHPDHSSSRGHAITQSLGGLPGFAEIDPHFDEESVVCGWSYLICSDGLTDMLDLQEIQSLVDADAEGSVRRLFSAAMAAGGEDNISIVLVAIEDGADVASGPV